MWKGSAASLALLAQAVRTWGATVTYDWEVTWTHAAPDGFPRSVIGINGQWPCPPIEANVGDTVVVNLKNCLGNQTTGLHFHGIDQINSNFMDGASMVNSCPIIPGSSLTYTFLANAPGTYWYHSHNMGQYPDGLRGALIVRDPEDPYVSEYDEEVILQVSDWYHSQTLPMVQAMLSPNNTQWRPPIPDSITVNEGGNRNIIFNVGKTYRVRLINFAALTAFMLQFESHNIQVIMTDGSYVQKQGIDQIRVAPAQRYDFLITASRHDRGQNFPYLFSMDLNRDFTESAVWTLNQTGYLITDPRLPYPGDLVVDSWQPYFEGDFSPQDHQAAHGPVTKTWQLDFGLCMDAKGIPRMCFNNQTYITQKTPTLYTAATVGEDNTDPDVYGAVLPFIVEYGDVVDLIVNNLDPAIHPFHLHGHQFQIVDHALSGAGVYTESAGKKIPPRRDVIAINGLSHARLRFVADNPGIFLFHCHIEWHVEMGLTATLIEAPERLRDYPIPQEMVESCQEQGIPTEGNAAGNVDDPTDISDFNTVPASQYYGAMWPYPNGPTSKRMRRKPNGQDRTIW